MSLRGDAARIVDAAIAAALPDAAVKRALDEIDLSGFERVILVAIGKAAWRMAKAARDRLGARIGGGVVITKYGHAQGALGDLQIFEAGHPVPDQNSYDATAAALRAVSNLTARDAVLFLISGGGSALFESPLVAPETLADVTKQLLACGADIREINCIRKRLSAVKGGRFALACAPAHVYEVVLSDVVGDPLDMIASGPAWPDSSTCDAALAICEKYALRLPDQTLALLRVETPKVLDNVTARVTGGVSQLCDAAAATCISLGYEPIVLTASLDCEAREAGAFLGAIARHHAGCGRAVAYIAGGETVVHLTGTGLGGRNQELALSAARAIAGLSGVCVFSVGSDGTDGPTDAAGGCVDGETVARLAKAGIDIDAALANNDAYHALKAAGDLIMTGPTGTNVNDVSVALVRG